MELGCSGLSRAYTQQLLLFLEQGILGKISRDKTKQNHLGFQSSVPSPTILPQLVNLSRIFPRSPSNKHLDYRVDAQL
ncbi:hypothetical protein RRG08_057644 [Elysia crispata]|uniref:Uncharacterized protein n=1 Tax=Elysia crispata TaxID=231223 RepID=A0AAE1A0S4_9GAST|nr:hypothetical protein RRG08_057644 [Elysia crispata]